ncbi:DUF6946 family protein [Chloroflexota bacterium]
MLFGVLEYPPTVVVYNIAMSKYFIPANAPEDWKQLLADPDKQWKTGYSAKSLAYNWQKRGDFPSSVKRVFIDSGIYLFQDIELLLAFPEWKVALPGGRRDSQNDIFVLAKGNNQLVSIMVEGKVRESFGEIVSEWKSDKSKRKQTRLSYLCDMLRLDMEQVNHIRYQLLHRTVSALIEAKRFNAQNALMLVHSFSQENDGFQDYCQFLSLFKLKGKMNAIQRPISIAGTRLYFAWVSE